MFLKQIYHLLKATVILVELKNTVFVNSTNISTNIETKVLSTPAKEMFLKQINHRLKARHLSPANTI